MDEVKPGAAGQERPQIRLDQAAARVTYANFMLVSTGAEEFIITLGVATGEENLIRVTDKVILSPKNAKRLAAALSQSVRMYEEKLGTISITGTGAAPEGQKK